MNSNASLRVGPAVRAEFDRAVKLHQVGELRAAEQSYRELLQKEPDFAPCLHMLGVIFLQDNRLSEALEYIGQAIALDPGQSVYFNNYGAALKRLERHVEALAFFHRAVAICPQYIDALSNLEKAYEELERFDSGVKERSSPAQLSTRPPDGQYTSKLYARALYTPSDIYEHVATLRLLATQCRAVTEFGVRSGVSTAALLAGIVGRQGTRLTSYDIVRCEEVDELEAAGGCAFKFILGNSCDVEIEKTDLLFIDTYHSGNQLWEELTRHHRSVKRWIVLHDTVVFGVTGENGEPGLMLAVRRFLAEFPQWSIVAEYRNNNGLTILGNMNP